MKLNDIIFFETGLKWPMNFYNDMRFKLIVGMPERLRRQLTGENRKRPLGQKEWSHENRPQQRVPR